MGEKSVLLSYILLFIGGSFGLHLLYLNRDKQAFLYWFTFGGYFGIGPVRDFFAIPRYVKEANNDPTYMAKIAKMKKLNRGPPFSFIEFTAQTSVSGVFSSVWLMAIPKEPVAGITFQPLNYLAPLATAIGVWLVGDLGMRKANIWWCIVGAYLGIPLSYLAESDMNSWCSFSSTLMFDLKGKSWRKQVSHPGSLLRRFLSLSFGVLIMGSLWTSYIYFNAEFTDNNGVKIKVRDAIHNFFHSPMYLEFKNALDSVWLDYWESGWSSALNKLLDLLDPSGERKALKVLGLSRQATQEEISAKFKKMSKEWHPDKHKGAEKKKEAEQKFIEIVDAYEKLSKIKRDRQRKNKKLHSGRDMDEL